MEENTLLIKKITFKHVFLFLRTKTVFHNSVPKHNFFFWKPKKTVFKNRFSEQFSKIATKQALSVLSTMTPKLLRKSCRV